MCEVDIYLNEKSEPSALNREVGQYEFNLEDQTLVTFSPLGEKQKFQFSDIQNVKWEERDDSMVIEGELTEG